MRDGGLLSGRDGTAVLVGDLVLGVPLLVGVGLLLVGLEGVKLTRREYKVSIHIDNMRKYEDEDKSPTYDLSLGVESLPPGSEELTDVTEFDSGVLFEDLGSVLSGEVHEGGKGPEKREIGDKR